MAKAMQLEEEHQDVSLQLPIKSVSVFKTLVGLCSYFPS